jgi:hypothetical protein
MTAGSKTAWGVKLTAQLHPLRKQKICESTSRFIITFTARCLIEAQEQNFFAFKLRKKNM